MNKKLFIMIFIVTVSLISSNVNAAPQFKYKLDESISSIERTYANSTTDSKGVVTKSLIQNAESYWSNKAVTKSEVGFKTDSSGIQEITYNAIDNNSSYSGYAQLRISIAMYPDKNANHNKENWDYAQVWLNEKYLKKYNSTVIRGVIAHEIGHVFGLAHNQATFKSLMYPYDDKRGSTIPISDEIKTINKKY